MWIINSVCDVLTLLTYDSKKKIQSLAIKLSVSHKMNKILCFPVYSLKCTNKIKPGLKFNLRSIEAIDVKVNITPSTKTDIYQVLNIKLLQILILHLIKIKWLFYN